MRSIDETILVIVLRFSSLDLTHFNSDKKSLQIFVREKKRYCQVSLKTYLTFYQIIAQLPEVLGLQFPATYNFLVAPLDIFNLSFLTHFTFIDCSSEASYDFIAKLYASTLYPLALIALLRLAQEVHLFAKFKWERPQSAQRIAAKYFRLMLFGIHIILPSLSVTIFRMFSCSDLDPENTTADEDSFLTADMSISCSSARYKSARIYSLCCVLLYPIGVPCFLFVLLLRRREDIVRREEPASSEAEEAARDIRLESLQGLFYAYKPEYW